MLIGASTPVTQFQYEQLFFAVKELKCEIDKVQSMSYKFTEEELREIGYQA